MVHGRVSDRSLYQALSQKVMGKPGAVGEPDAVVYGAGVGVNRPVHEEGR